MGVVPAWSYSKLDTFVTCPRQYHAKYVEKSVKETESEQQLYGTRVHTDFELHQVNHKPLPPDLDIHQPFMDTLRQGKLIGVERRVGLTKALEPIIIDNKYFKPPPGVKLWWQGIIDYMADLGEVTPGRRRARIVDYKTGKQHAKMEQLKLFAIFGFAEGYDEVEVMYYWTKTRQALPRMIFPREHMMKLLGGFVPDLKQFAEAYKTDLWQPRRNGLCKEWCPVTSCDFNRRR